LGDRGSYHELREYGMEVYDPWASPEEVKHEYGIKSLNTYPESNGYSAIVLAVAHNEFKNINLHAHKEKGCVIYDVKGILTDDLVDDRL